MNGLALHYLEYDYLENDGPTVEERAHDISEGRGLLDVRRMRGALDRHGAHAPHRVGDLVAALAARHRLTIAATGVVAVVALVSALNVESGSEFRDFFNSEADFVKSLDVAGEHFADGSTNETRIYVEGGLTDPASLRAIDWSRVQEVDRLDSRLARLELDYARQALDVVLAQFEEGRAALDAVERARVQESLAWQVFYDAKYEWERAKLDLLRRTGDLAAAFR